MTKFTDKSFIVGSTTAAAAKNYAENYDRIFNRAMEPDEEPVAQHAICGECMKEDVPVFATEGHAIHACASCTQARRSK